MEEGFLTSGLLRCRRSARSSCTPAKSAHRQLAPPRPTAVPARPAAPQTWHAPPWPPGASGPATERGARGGEWCTELLVAELPLSLELKLQKGHCPRSMQSPVLLRIMMEWQGQTDAQSQSQPSSLISVPPNRARARPANVPEGPWGGQLAWASLQPVRPRPPYSATLSSGVRAQRTGQ